MKKIQNRNLQVIILLLALLAVVSQPIFANSAAQEEPPYRYYFPLIFSKSAVPPAYFTTSWYMTPQNVSLTYQMGCQAGVQTVQIPGAQDSLVILDFGQPWGDGIQYGTLLLREPAYDLNSTNDIIIYTKNYINGYMACSDGVSKIDVGIGTTNFAYYINGVCSQASWYCTESRAYAHGGAWAEMVRTVYNWVISSGYGARVRVSGATDIELAWNYASISRKWVEGFDAHDNSQVIFYEYGTCDGCPTRLAPNNNPDLYYDWTFPNVHYVSWWAAPAWPIPEIYANSGINARQWAYLSKWGTEQGYSRMQFLSAFTQYQACLSSPGDTLCPLLDNTPQEAWYQLFSETNYWTQTALPAIPWMTDIDWP